MAKKKTQPEAPKRPDVRDFVRLCSLLSDETRAAVVVMLDRQGEMNVTQICAALEQSQPAVSHHLSLLRVSGVVQSRREGKHNYYSNGELGTRGARFAEEATAWQS